MNAYCLFCRTEYAGDITAAIQASGDYRAIYPQIIQRKWVRGTATEVPHPCLPGYVFIYSDEPIADFSPLRRHLGVIRPLGQENEHYELAGDDLKFARAVYGMGGTVGIQKAYREGDGIRLADGVFAGLTGRILWFDRRKQRAKVEVTFDETVYTLWVGIDMIEKPDE
ncbi:MAG: hypothetical protein IKH18_06625 [Clostridia bacterium]|nr:hypothetical protein [Clostridia bacterium]